MKKRELISTIMLILGAALITAALIIVYIAYPNRANPIDSAIADFFSAYVSGTLTTIMEVITYLGESIIYIAVLMILYYVWDKKKAYKTIFVLISSIEINAVAKGAFRLDRPDDSWGYDAVEKTSYGLPSGHAQISTTFWGSLSIIISKWGMLTVGIALPLLIGFSRIFLVVHWFTDVLMGFGLGLIVLGLFIFLDEPVSNYFEKKSITMKMLTILAIFIIFAIPIIFLHRGSVPNEFKLKISILKVLVLFATASLSYIVEGKLVDFNSKADKWWKVLLRLLIVIIPIAIIYVYDEILTDDMTLNALKISLDMVIYGLMGPILILLLPWVIKKLDL
ncbi:MAG: phosphatase PAP2 family protein [Candidatus Heimdallarchaeota archaeon]|nr:phosphatase PAP2 family protein [Candidatus Heimdallarchaeota archaeon]MCK4954437.1 phosphatase PAP2 family protein [Candidatus Heimdallarchaeota archaeon]